MKNRKRLTPYSAVAMSLTGVLLLVLCVSLLIPLVWCLYASCKGTLDYALDAFSLPSVWHFENYAGVLEKLQITTATNRGVVVFSIWDLFLHSAVFSVSIPLVTTIFTAFMAYVIARYRNKFSKFLYNFGIVLMILPIVGSMPSAMSLKKALGVYDNLFLWILTSPQGCFTGMNFLLLYQCFRGLPKAYSEAARIDGAGHYTVMFRIYLPMAIPLCTVIFVLGFLGNWNDYGTPMIWLPSYPNLAYGMYLFQYQASQFHATQPEILAGFVISMIPSVILYVSMQKLIVEKMQIGGLKG